MGRRTNEMQPKNVFYIFTNGKTEEVYFNLLKSKNNVYQIKVKFINGNARYLLEKIIEEKGQLKNCNQIWAVFDIDNAYEEQALYPALKLGEEHKIHIAYSNIAFEVWLLSHYQELSKNLNNNELIKKMNDLFKGSLRLDREYNKATENDLKKYFVDKRVPIAVENAKKVHQSWIKKLGDSNKKYPIEKWNPCTTVYELVEALMLSKF